jgi:hypothetical protein
VDNGSQSQHMLGEAQRWFSDWSRERSIGWSQANKLPCFGINIGKQQMKKIINTNKDNKLKSSKKNKKRDIDKGFQINLRLIFPWPDSILENLRESAILVLVTCRGIT